jgi:hypothetical protein
MIRTTQNQKGRPETGLSANGVASPDGEAGTAARVGLVGENPVRCLLWERRRPVGHPSVIRPSVRQLPP